jgi:predicted acetyltransferase
VKEKTKKKQIIRLWKGAFDDSDKFIRLYFNSVYRDENAIVLEKKGKILASLQMLPYTMTFCGEEISVAYISGACTAPSEQRKGLMKQLLQNAFAEMQQRKIALTALIPAEKWLFNYYRLQEYTEVFEFSMKVYTRHEYIVPEKELTVLQAGANPGDDVYAFFNRKLRERPACILHTYDDLVIILKDLKISKGKCFVAYTLDRQPVGMAFALSPNKNCIPESVLIKEILFENEKVRQHLLFEITKHFKAFKAIYRIPFCDSLITYPYGMARVIDAERLIRIWSKAHPESGVSVSEMERMDVKTLTSHLFDYPGKTACMSLMLD